jgi:hypothetical protein
MLLISLAVCLLYGHSGTQPAKQVHLATRGIAKWSVRRHGLRGSPDLDAGPVIEVRRPPNDASRRRLFVALLASLQATSAVNR